MTPCTQFDLFMYAVLRQPPVCTEAPSKSAHVQYSHSLNPDATAPGGASTWGDLPAACTCATHPGRASPLEKRMRLVAAGERVMSRCPAASRPAAELTRRRGSACLAAVLRCPAECSVRLCTCGSLAPFTRCPHCACGFAGVSIPPYISPPGRRTPEPGRPFGLPNRSFQSTSGPADANPAPRTMNERAPGRQAGSPNCS